MSPDGLNNVAPAAVPATISIDADAIVSRDAARLAKNSIVSVEAQSSRLSSEKSRTCSSSGTDILEKAPSVTETRDETEFDGEAEPRDHVRRAWLRFPGASYFALYTRTAESLTSWLIVCFAVVSAAAAGAPIPVIAIIFGKLIDSFPSTEDQVRARLAQLLITAVIYLVLTYAWSVLFGLLGEKIASYHRKAVVAKLLRLDVTALHRLQQQGALGVKESTGDDGGDSTASTEEKSGLDVDGLLTTHSHTIQVATSEKAGLMLQSASYFIAAFVTSFILNAKVAAILFAAIIPTMMTVITVANRRGIRFGRQSSVYESSAHATAEQSINGIATIQTLGIGDKITSVYSKLLHHKKTLEIRRSTWTAVMLGGIFFITYSANSLAYWLAGRESQRGDQNSAGTVFALVMLIIDASFVVGSVGPLLQIFVQGAQAGTELKAIIDIRPSAIDPFSKSGEPVTGTTFDSAIEFRNVDFTYEKPTVISPTHLALRQLNLSIPPRSMTGIVGTSGSGKSTLVSLLLRLYDPSAGDIYISGRDLRHINLASYRKHVAICSQDNVLFPGTIMDNICIGLDSADESDLTERCVKALTAANCVEFVNKLPNGLHTRISSSGELSSLSGGQKQRLALARALIRRPKLLILDEFTSALDAKTERAIMATLQAICAESNTTIVMIAHRLRTIRAADKIVVMSHGSLVEEGNHDDLITYEGHYWRLLASQRDRNESYVSTFQDITPDSVSPSDSLEELPIEKLGFAHNRNIDVTTEQAASLSPLQVLAKCLQHAGPDSIYLLFGLLAASVCGLLVIGQSIILGNLIVKLNQAASGTDISIWCLYLFIVAIAAFFAYTASGACLGLVSERFTIRLQTKSLGHLLTQDMAWFLTQKAEERTEGSADTKKSTDSSTSSQSSGESIDSSTSNRIISELRQDAGLMKSMSGPIFGVIISGMVSLFGGIILGLCVSWRISVVVLPALPVMLAAGFLRIYILSLQEQRQSDGYAALAGYVRLMLGEIKTVTALGMEKEVLRKFNVLLDAEQKRGSWFIVVSSIPFAVALSITYFVYALAFWWGSQKVREEQATSLQFFIVLPALLFSTQAAGQVFSFAPEMTRALAAARRVFHLLDQQPRILAGPASGVDSADESEVDLETCTSAMRTPSPSSELKVLEQKSAGLDIDFQNVTFAHPRQTHPALQNVSFRIAAGSECAIVGHSGSGKSTVLALCERLYDPQVGCIRMNGCNVKDYNVDDLRSRMSYVTQEPLLFPGSIIDNILLGLPASANASREDVIQLCRDLGFDTFISSLPNGYDTEVGVKGGSLSGGQRQRIAIARAIIRNPSVLLLDEATASLDLVSEQDIWEALRRWRVTAPNRTIVNVTHRLSSVQYADKIFVLDKGRICESGSHETLLSREAGVYRELVQLQSVDDQ